MKAIELHINHLKKQIPKLQADNYKIGLKNVIIRSDSKGRSLMPYFTNTNRINLIYRPGKGIDDNFMKEYTLNRIKRTSKPIVILFFATCELTDKKGKYIYLPAELERRVDEVIDKYIKYKHKILQYNSEATVIYLDCPYFSLTVWNFLRGHPSPGSFDLDQKRLEQAILAFNLKLKNINGDRCVPRLALDFIYSIKKKNKPIKKLRNYSLLRDGVHAGPFLTELWALRIMRLISKN